MSSPPFPLGPNYGAMFMSTLLCVGFWGVACMQTFIYFVSYQSDKLIFKLLVLFVCLLDTTHQIMIIQGVYTYFVPQFGNYSEFSTIIPTLIWAPLITTVVAIITQSFFIYRIWKFNEKPLVVPCLWVSLLSKVLSEANNLTLLPLQVSSSLVRVSYVHCLCFRSVCQRSSELCDRDSEYSYLYRINASSSEALEGGFLKPITIAYFAVTTSVDLTIAASLTYMFIYQTKQIPGGDGRSKRMVHRLAIYSINSGAWTAIFSILDMILFVVFSSNALYVVFDFPLCPLYCNMLLANLNVRSHLREMGDTMDGKTSNDAASFIVHRCANLKDSEPETQDVIFTQRVIPIPRTPVINHHWDDSLRSHPYSKGSISNHV
ncbi:hypothetical protein SERLA73DRAFT_178389 [Serpula lacrymans var. lacrymans S7.3]|uniref:DUF6534 domain-containing protein n=2 Tax=Serpula lacrymans var. lacrymans TaxID=341189 RepID=F8PRD1_SERL3|nr:uncharacterized protein SERLADRAFT_462801 [Serpula lacrymans var. lacrymans S7.9]EGO00554.1 hypothetical protein SERLA73DRAFT_178389 [Serpula lacrymans var. lacrymans S7.3]EGO26108.1 hypothetical protein SERLADRAFT_462801 [Serpula lacrymans var. lacrymans S7.9]